MRSGMVPLLFSGLRKQLLRFVPRCGVLDGAFLGVVDETGALQGAGSVCDTANVCAVVGGIRRAAVQEVGDGTAVVEQSVRDAGADAAHDHITAQIRTEAGITGIVGEKVQVSIREPAYVSQQ